MTGVASCSCVSKVAAAGVVGVNRLVELELQALGVGVRPHHHSLGLPAVQQLPRRQLERLHRRLHDEEEDDRRARDEIL